MPESLARVLQTHRSPVFSPVPFLLTQVLGTVSYLSFPRKHLSLCLWSRCPLKWKERRWKWGSGFRLGSLEPGASQGAPELQAAGPRAGRALGPTPPSGTARPSCSLQCGLQRTQGLTVVAPQCCPESTPRQGTGHRAQGSSHSGEQKWGTLKEFPGEGVAFVINNFLQPHEVPRNSKNQELLISSLRRVVSTLQMHLQQD